MDFTCLRLETDHGGPCCHLLNASGLQILLECPLDMSLLQFFLPPSFHCYGKRPADGPLYADRKKSRKLDPIGSALDAHFNVQVGSDGRTSSGSPDDDDDGDSKDCSHASLTRSLNGQVFLDAEPWYKTAEFGLLDVRGIEIVLVSSPEGMLGLPFLTRRPEFTGKIYATIPTAKLGQLLMEELVSMHDEYIQTFGSPNIQIPAWLDVATLEALPNVLKKVLVGDDGIGRVNWHSLYRKGDIETCMRKVASVHYDEEINVLDYMQIRPVSSGSEIGAANWILSGPICWSYFSGSKIVSGPAMGLNLAAHMSAEVLLFSNMTWEELNSPQIGISTDDSLVVSKEAVDVVKAGGSVLVTIRGIGVPLELLEAVSQQLLISEMQHIPMFFVSPVSEEMLVYSNTVPEWLCDSRQEKLYAGEALFGHVELIKEKRLYYLSGLHAPEVVNIWREPCIVFAAHWSLRIGPAVHLLRKWCREPRCLLILTEVV